MSNSVKVLVLRTAGTNCDAETVFAFKTFGAAVDLVHINRLLNKEVSLQDYHILALPGGFSYGDDIESGRIFANELRLKLGEDLRRFISDGKLLIGICNGFQILVKAGILPGPLTAQEENDRDTAVTTTLMTNDSGKFEDRWTHLRVEGQSPWLAGLKKMIYLPVAHGEGKFVSQDAEILKCLKANGQIAFRYCTESGGQPQYPENPNGSVDDIAGITDKTGRILGLMPHPERHFLFTQHPSWTRLPKNGKFGDGAKIFENGVNYVKEKLIL
ncbi:MAG: phosphoribosylformylglycinamidine synthase I [Omnitrophica WOR_2 bacterium RIFCSPHIGHO2_01_FULL_48_9]|nr:MAG: phosphoribosylformylglycinamidine synthase I [Omnitrophica WOR_2 bacterium RIFCSPHIGHO2_01_FULL_48_9]